MTGMRASGSSSLRLLAVLSLTLPTAVACGGGGDATKPAQGHAAPATSGAEAPRGSQGPMQVGGLLGSIPRHAVEQTLNARIERFGRCFFARSEQLEVLGGRMTLKFRIATDGSVRWVLPARSSVGDRDTERCVLEKAATVRFPPPTGGEAEASWSFEMEPDERIRPPASVHVSQFEALAVEHASGLRRACGGGPFEVTVYIAPGGQLLAAGVATDDPEQASALDCVITQVRQWESWPDPGSYVGKGSFRVP